MATLTYSFDTSALIDGIERFYPIEHFPRLWEQIDDLIQEGRLLISEEAWLESVKLDLPLKKWCESSVVDRTVSIIETDDDIADRVGVIVTQFPKLAKPGRKSGADPFVIAVAEIRGAMVITGEKQGGPSNVTIPYMCNNRGTVHGRFVDVVRNEGWRFT